MFTIKDNRLYKYHDIPGVTEIVVPQGVTSIADEAFYCCRTIKKVVLPQTISEIGFSAFTDCNNLETINLPEQLEYLLDETFWCCSSLKEIKLPSSLRVLHSSAFSNCDSLEKIILNEGLTMIHSSAFACCSALKEITLPQSLKAIGRAAFYGCTSLKHITIPGGVKSIDAQAFRRCQQLDSVVIDEGVHNIQSAAFEHCTSLTQLELPSTLDSIFSDAFADCSSLEDIVLPERLKHLMRSSFENCAVKSVQIPLNIINIPDNPFPNCKHLTEINARLYHRYFTSTNGILYNKDKTTLIAYPAGKTDVSYTLPSTVKRINDKAFRGCEYLKRLSIYGIEFDPSIMDWSEVSPNTIMFILRTKDFSTKLMLTSEKYKLALSTYLLSGLPEARNYIKQNLPNVMAMLMDNSFYELIKQITECGSFITKRNIMKYIDMAIEHTRVSGDPQIQVFLTNYKNDHFPGASSLNNLEI